ncbi:MAG TPA: histidine kinase [Vicinamibacterales bacterium]|nr:histidine kinase [Vicinamibacterales bacterium]
MKPARSLDWRIALGCAVALTVLFAIQATGQPVPRRDLDLTTALQLQAVTWGMWLLLLPAVAVAARLRPLEGRPSAGWWLFTTAVGLVFVVVHTVLAAIGRWALGVAASPDLTTVISNGFTAGFASNCLRYAAILLAIQAIAYHDAVRAREQRAARLEADLARAQLTNVEACLRPHFLFNTLNSISALIADDPGQAEKMIGELGDLLRASLTAEPQRQVRLDDELAFTEKYLGIERVRFLDRLRVTIEAPPDTRQALVPHLILQPLVENAIRHGIAPLESGGRVSVAAARDHDRLRLIVRDDGVGPGTAVTTDGRGIGLAGVRARLTQLYGDGFRFDLAPSAPRGTVASIDIPYRTTEI